MYKYLFLIILIVFLFGAGFFVGRKSISIQYIRPAEVSEAITNIINYTNYIERLEYITNSNIKYDELVIMYNDLLKRSKEASLSYDTLFINYEKLEKIANRKLYFLVGGELEYNIEKQIVDLGLTAGVEYYNIGYTLGYLFLDRQISLNVSYRF